MQREMTDENGSGASAVYKLPDVQLGRGIVIELDVDIGGRQQTLQIQGGGNKTNDSNSLFVIVT
jgi:hypothetical protein